jgi:hypothetical protein
MPPVQLVKKRQSLGIILQGAPNYDVTAYYLSSDGENGVIVDSGSTDDLFKTVRRPLVPSLTIGQCTKNREQVPENTISVRILRLQNRPSINFAQAIERREVVDCSPARTGELASRHRAPAARNRPRENQQLINSIRSSAKIARQNPCVFQNCT